METDELTEDQIRAMITPDVNRLDEQWARQPRNRRRVSKLVADAAADAKRAKNAVKVAEANVSLLIREKPDKYGFKGKLTEGVVDSLTVTSQSVMAANEKLIQAEHKADILKGLLAAVDDMRCALENEVRLEARDYFARPRVPPEAGEVARDRIRDAKVKAGLGNGKKKHGG